MKKAVVYVLIAVVVGLVVTLTPLIAITETEQDNRGALLPNYFSEPKETPQDTRSTNTQLYLEAIAVSFIVALAVYALFKYKITHSGV